MDGAGDHHRGATPAGPDLLGLLAHDLMTPLTATAGLAEVLRMREERRLGAESLELLVELEAGSRRAADIVRQTLDYARATAAEGRSRVDVRAMLEDVAAELRTLVQERRAAIRWDGAAHELWGRPLVVRQVLANLVANAVRHGAHDVAVGLEVTTDGVVVEVRDDGPGMPDAVARALEARGPAVSNGRLGLALTRSLVAAEGGWITATPREGGGTTVAFVLPQRRRFSRDETPSATGTAPR
ncbi:sensor histidine kinase KdpD [Conexibacter sp. SYSU D00693]|uniref:sensor histidine kinase n=1 Tax=Conexibacter sp. SYSU D00693 TaxID=2812560 RepID=UPI00196A25ED|nr:HAMP domain-containing sensor histidine kinase [Conexibacter sp. SYSU D00693]